MLGDELLFFFVEGADLADRTVAVVVFKALGQHILGTDEQHVLTFQRKEIRAFPHEAEAPVVFRQGAFKTPMKAVFAGIEQQHAPLVHPARPHHTAIAAVFRAPDFRIAEIVGA